MFFLRFIAVFALTAACTGCVNLKVVRDFAGEAAEFSAYPELTTRFRDTYQRELPYVSGEGALLAQANDRQRRAVYPDLVKLHRHVALYLRTLASLAGDRTFEVAKGLDSLEAGIQVHADFGIEAAQVEAGANLAKVVASWVSSGYQARAMRSMLKEGDPHLQTLLAAMAALVRQYKQSHENEKRGVLGLLEVELPFADTPEERLLATLAKAHLQAKVEEYRLAGLRYAQAEKGLAAIRDGHRQLVENADRLSRAETRDAIRRFTRDLRVVRFNLQAVHAQ